jgi:beta-glucanase (GH16 family)
VANGAGNAAQQIYGYYTPSACQVHGGALHLAANNRPVTAGGRPHPYTTCRMDSSFSFLYGRREFRAQLPRERGYWPVLWAREAKFCDNQVSG